MKVYHVAPAINAASIEEHGFLDATGAYQADAFVGVRVTDRVLASDQTVRTAEVVVTIEVDEDLISEYEWREPDKAYREWLVPGAILNTCPRSVEPRPAGSA